MPPEPIYLWYTERDNRDLFGRKHPPTYGFMPEIWKCREHPEWQGEDIPEEQVVTWERTGQLAHWPGAPRALWQSDSVQAHLAMHLHVTFRDAD